MLTLPTMDDLLSKDFVLDIYTLTLVRRGLNVCVTLYNNFRSTMTECLFVK